LGRFKWWAVLALGAVLSACGGGGGGGGGGGLTREQAAQWTVAFLGGLGDIGGLIDATGRIIDQLAGPRAVRLAPVTPQPRGGEASLGLIRQVPCQPQVQASQRDSDSDGIPDWALVDFGQQGCQFPIEDAKTVTIKNGFKVEDTGPGLKITYNPSELGGRKFTAVFQAEVQFTEAVSGSLEVRESKGENRKTSQVAFYNLSFSFQGAKTGTFAWNGSATHVEVDTDQDGEFGDPGTETYLILSNLRFTKDGTSVTYSTPQGDPLKWVEDDCDYPIDGTLQIQTSAGSATVDFGTPADCALATVYVGGQAVGTLNLDTGQFI